MSRVVVIIEDDSKIRDVLATYLHDAGYATLEFGDGLGAIDAIREKEPAAIILDLMLPGLGGVHVCERLRKFCAAPILMLTARIDEVDRLRGLDSGADDYVCKPFSAREVVARIAALIRRAEGRVTRPGTAGGPAHGIDDAGMRIAWGGEWLPLSPTEFQLLAMLMRQPGRVFTRGQMLDAMSQEYRDVSDRAIDSHIKNIRRKIVAIAPDARVLVSVYGIGYRFER